MPSWRVHARIVVALAAVTAACEGRKEAAPIVQWTDTIGEVTLTIGVPSDYQLTRVTKTDGRPDEDILNAVPPQDSEGRPDILLALRPPVPTTLDEASRRAAPWMLGDSGDKPFRKLLKSEAHDDAFLVVVQGSTRIYVETWRRHPPAVRCWVRIHRTHDEGEMAARIRWGEERCASLKVTSSQPD